MANEKTALLQKSESSLEDPQPKSVSVWELRVLLVPCTFPSMILSPSFLVSLCYASLLDFWPKTWGLVRTMGMASLTGLYRMMLIGTLLYVAFACGALVCVHVQLAWRTHSGAAIPERSNEYAVRVCHDAHSCLSDRLVLP